MRRLGRKHDAASLRREAGYTLTEMLVVIGIIALIAAVLTPAVLGQMGHARLRAAQLQLNTVAAEVETFRNDVGRYPTQAEGLAALLKPPGSIEGWAGPYAKTKSLKDPWGDAIVYLPGADGRSFEVESLGPTGKPGGAGSDAVLKAPED
jgi:general secretion pathway protein G